MRTPRHAKCVRMAGPVPSRSRVSFRKRPGFAAVHDTLTLVFDNGVVTGMVVHVSADIKQHWLSQRPLSLHEVVIGVEAEGADGVVCICRPTVKDSGVSALCGADHAVTVESWMDEE